MGNKTNKLFFAFLTIQTAVLFAVGYYVYELNKKVFNSNMLIGNLLREMPKPKIDIPVDSLDITYGKKQAPVTIILYQNYECQYCKAFFDSTFYQINDKYIKPGLVQLVVKNVPGRNKPNAYLAAKYALAAYAQDKFDALNKVLFAHQTNLDTTLFEQWCKNSEINLPDLLMFMSKINLEKKLAKDKKVSLSLGIEGTPAFVINSRIIKGHRSFIKFSEIIDEELEYYQSQCD